MARNQSRRNVNHWQVSRKEAGQIFFKPLLQCYSYSVYFLHPLTPNTTSHGVSSP